jgi:nitrate/nitrite-specific signal transduction histidine kinase
MLMQVDLEHKILTKVREQCEEEYQKKLAELRNEMEAKHAKELEAERKTITEQFDELTSIMKKSAEEEQVCLTLIEFTYSQVCVLMVYCTLLRTRMKLNDVLAALICSSSCLRCQQTYQINHMRGI